ncbi:MAG: cysteine hydrolase [Candidatus Obscuribacterales bacterium]|nr:cysteine hydrolase [Candidatus Obscuribacterales bacterium]
MNTKISPPTLRKLLNIPGDLPKLANATIVVVDAQREYLDGKLPLVGIEKALAELATLLAKARKAGAKIVHVKHLAAPGAAVFDPEQPYVQIIDAVAPLPGEAVFEKYYPNSFSSTEFTNHLKELGQDDLVVAGFMTHACISATVRSALDHGYKTVVVESACATRDLPGSEMTTVPAKTIHETTMAALGDLFATIVPNAQAFKE